jgi:hypothetical protein
LHCCRADAANAYRSLSSQVTLIAHALSTLQDQQQGKLAAQQASLASLHHGFNQRLQMWAASVQDLTTLGQQLNCSVGDVCQQMQSSVSSAGKQASRQQSCQDLTNKLDHAQRALQAAEVRASEAERALQQSQLDHEDELGATRDMYFAPSPCFTMYQLLHHDVACCMALCNRTTRSTLWNAALDAMRSSSSCIRKHRQSLCRCSADMDQRTAALHSRLAEVNAEVVTRKQAVASSAAAAQRRIELEAANARSSTAEANRQAALAQEQLQQKEREVTSQLTTLSYKHMEALSQVRQESSAKLAIVEVQVKQLRDIMLEAFDTASNISQDFTTVDKHLCEVCTPCIRFARRTSSCEVWFGHGPGIGEPQQHPGESLMQGSLDLLLVMLQMQLLDECYSVGDRLPPEEAGDGHGLRKMMLLLRLHFAHVTEHVQEMAKSKWGSQRERCVVHKTILPALSAQAKQLHSTVAKLVRTCMSGPCMQLYIPRHDAHGWKPGTEHI